MCLKYQNFKNFQGIAVLIVLIGISITFMTVLSMSAVSTNGKIEGGGTYFMLTRSVGAPIGTTIGFSFALGNNIVSAMYILGSIEVLMYTFDIKIVDDD